MKIKYFYINSDVEICVVIGQLPLSKTEQLKLKQSAIPVKNQKRAFEILNQQYQSTKFDEFYAINYPVLWTAESNLILN